MTRRQTIATTYGLEIGRLAEQIDKAGQPDLAPQCQLVVVEGSSMGRLVPLGAKPIVVGADASCDLPLDDERVSARHVEVVRAGPGFHVRDLGSKNGILYQGALVRAIDLPVGGTFVVGRTPLRVQAAARYADIPPSSAERFGELVGKSLAMRELFAVLELAAASDVTLLVEGETGTGKELVARSVHDRSARKQGPFVAIDCGAIPEALIESALFGHVKGAFTGADDKRAGAFVQAHGGTLFLDEIGNLAPASQARLLRVLETRRVRAVGADDERTIDVRIIAAANTDLEDAMRRGAMRADLFYRLAVVKVRMPPLRTRTGDLAPTVAALLAQRGFPASELLPEQLAMLRAHPWPGNVRELRNVVERALALSPGARSAAELRLIVDLAGPGGQVARHDGLDVRTDLPMPEAKARVVEAFERTYLTELVAQHGDNLSAMARAAGIDRKTLRALLDRHALRRGR